MLQFESAATLSSDYFLFQDIPAEKILYFDIETTGLSAQSSYVYLIGAAYFDGEHVRIRQWFLDDMAQEKELIRSFLSFSDSFELLIHFNGTTFDVPYLQKKCRRHCLPDTFSTKKQLDLYKEFLPLKSLLKLSGMKQRVLEQYVGCHREDPFSGGDLISVYIDFVGKYRYEQLLAHKQHTQAVPDFHDTGLRALPESPSKALLSVLLLHNHEDLTGLIRISPLRLLCKLLSGRNDAYWVLSVAQSDTCDTMSVRLSSAYPFAGLAEIPALKEGLSFVLPCEKPSPETRLLLQCVSDGFLVHIPLRRDTLKFFFADYKDYYYLPLEDRALHKSVAEFVDKAYRQKATRNTCYQKKTGVFLPQSEELFTPAFKDHSKAKLSFFEPEQLTGADNEKILRWISGLLTPPQKK